MVRILAASSLHHAIETINPENQTAIKGCSLLHSGPEFKHSRKKS